MPQRKSNPGVIPLGEPGHFEIRIRVRNRLTGRWINTKRRLRGVTLEQAVEERERLQNSLRDGEEEVQARNKITLTEYSESWMENLELMGAKFSTLEHRKSVLHIHLRPAFGSWYLQAIRRHDVTNWLKKMATRKNPRTKNQYSPNTVNGWLRIFKALLSSAYAEFEWGPSPIRDLRGMRTPPRSTRETNSLNSQELKSFLKNAKELYPQHYTMIFLGFTTGMRWGELAALHWDSIDEQNMQIYVERAHFRGRLGTVKTGEPRIVALLPEMLEVLRNHRQKMIKEQKSGFNNGLVFPSATGGYSYQSMLTKPFQRICEKAKIQKRLTTKVFRRTFNNLLRRQGVDREVLRSLTGHSSEAMTSLYSNVSALEQQMAVRKIIDSVKSGNC